MRTKRGYLCRVCYSKGVVSHHHLCVADIQSQAEDWESFIVKKQKISGVPYKNKQRSTK